MKSTKKVVVLFLVFCTLIALASPVWAASARKKIRWGTASVGSGTYTYAATLAKIVNTYSKKIEIEVYPSAGANVLPADLLSGEAQVVLGNTQTSYDAFHGTGLFNGKPNPKLRLIFPQGYGETHVIVRANSDIKTVADMKGKKVALTTQGSSSYQQGYYLLSAYGLSEKDMSIIYLSWQDQVSALKDGDVDAVIFGTPRGSSVITDAMTSNLGMRLIPVPNDIWEKIAAMIPEGYFVPVDLPANTYPNQPEAVSTFAIVPNWMCMADLDDETVTEILTVFWDNKAEAEDAYASVKLTNEELLNKTMCIPWHPAAEKFFKERGLLKK